jgi:arylsulfatase A-like enzyme
MKAVLNMQMINACFRALLICVVSFSLWGCSSGTDSTSKYCLHHLVPPGGDYRLISLDPDQTNPPDAETMKPVTARFARVRMARITRRSIVLLPKRLFKTEINTGRNARFRADITSRSKTGMSMGITGIEIEVVNSTDRNSRLIKQIPLPADTAGSWIPVDIDLSSLAPGQSTFSMKLVCNPDADTSGDGQIFVGAPVITSGDPPKSHSNIIYVLLDSLRADHVGCYGYPGGITPFIDQLSRSSLQCCPVMAPASWTMPSVNAMFTGVYPSRYPHAGDPLRELSHSVETLAEILARHGFLTVGISSNILIVPGRGYDRGFDVFDEYNVKYCGTSAATPMYARTVELLEKYRDLPVFIYFHSMDPHDRYCPPDPFKQMYSYPDKPVREVIQQGNAGKLMTGMETNTRESPEPYEVHYLSSLYKGEIRCMDSIVEWTIRKMHDLGMAQDLFLIVGSDHGEEFMERGMLQHARTLREESIRVPLLLSKRTFYRTGSVLDDPVSLVDVSPTILNVLGIPVPEGLDGIPIHSGGTGQPHRTLHAQLHDLMHPTPSWRVACKDGKKIVKIGTGSHEYYDLDTDPGEFHHLDGGGDGFTSLTADFDEAYRVEKAGGSKPADVDEDTRAHLKALGYIQ